jgi:pimeloyl-ACP methyl ester carboxylesterase
MNRKISFESAGTICRGQLFLSQKGQLGPCIVFAHGLTLRAKDGLSSYVEIFNKNGFHCLVFDYRNFGESDGFYRDHVSVSGQLKDIRNALDFAKTQPEIDKNKLFLWGTSFGGGHVFSLAAESLGLRGVISQCPMLDGFEATLGILRYAGIWALLRLSAFGLLDVLLKSFTGKSKTIPTVGRPGTIATMATPEAQELVDIAAQDWPNRVGASLLLTAWLYRPIAKSKKLKCPVLVVNCTLDSVAPSEETIKLHTKHPTLFKMLTFPIGHFALYREPYRNQAIAKQIDFLCEKMI